MLRKGSLLIFLLSLVSASSASAVSSALISVNGGGYVSVPVESLGAEVYVHFGVGAGGPQSEELAELAQDSGAADVPSAGEGMAVARLEPGTKARAGQPARLGLHPESIHIFDARSGRNLALAKAAQAATAGDGAGTGAAEPEGDQPSSTRLS